MRIVVTGSSGHLGEGLTLTLRARGDDVVGLDLRKGRETDLVASINDREAVRESFRGAGAVVHTATLHKPHVATHSRQAFVDTNVTGTLHLLEEAVAAGVGRFVFTSTTSTFGRAMVPAAGAPAAWITEDVPPEPKNIYGVTKLAAEHLCELFHRRESLPCLVLRTSRFFPDADDRRAVRETYADENVKANEYLYRRVDLDDAVQAHLAALERAPAIGFDRYIISATSPFEKHDLSRLRADPGGVVAERFPEYREIYARHGWRLFDGIERVYVNAKARGELGWRPKVDFGSVLAALGRGEGIWGDLARRVGEKGYHDQTFPDGPYPVDE